MKTPIGSWTTLHRNWFLAANEHRQRPIHIPAPCMHFMYPAQKKLKESSNSSHQELWGCSYPTQLSWAAATQLSGTRMQTHVTAVLTEYRNRYTVAVHTCNAAIIKLNYGYTFLSHLGSLMRPCLKQQDEPEDPVCVHIFMAPIVLGFSSMFVNI